MPIDTTPSTVATNALQALPFDSLIGGPLDAAIKAQANAALTSYKFIEAVGLYVDKDTGEKKAVNVSFQYNNAGQMTTLTVPLLVIVPIPYLAINNISIDFIANISASSSSVTETSTDEDMGVDASAEASIGYGPFSLKVNAKANYSSKKHSKASSDSKYSVEYTMNVHVDGGQADMPAGLATILNILQGSASSISPGDTMAISPASVFFNKSQNATLQVTVKDTHGILAAGAKVTLQYDSSVFGKPTVKKGTSDNSAQHLLKTLDAGMENSRILPRHIRSYFRRYPQQGGLAIDVHSEQNKTPLASSIATIGLGATAMKHQSQVIMSLYGSDQGASFTAVTNEQGVVLFGLTVLKSVVKDTQGDFIVSADVPVGGKPEKEATSAGESETQKIPFIIIPIISTDPINITTDIGNNLELKGTEVKKVTITVKDGSGNPMNDCTVTGNDPSSNLTITPQNEGKTDENGSVKFDITAKSDKSLTGSITFTAQAGTQSGSVPLHYSVGKQ